MIQQLLGSPVVYQFYDIHIDRFLVREASFPFWNMIYYHNLHLSFKGSCVSWEGGTVSYKKKVEISIYSFKEMPWLI